MSIDIQNKVVLVTGANRGIGKALVEGFIGAGASKVYAAVRDPQKAHDLVHTFGPKVVPVELDLTKADTIAAAASTCADTYVLVNNAGVLKSTGVLSPEALDSLQYEFDTNVYGLVRIAQAFAPVLKKNGGGALVQLNSVVSMKSFPDFSTYCASKAAAYSLTQALQSTLAAQGTQVFSVHPGPIATDMGHDAGFAEIADPPACVAEALLAAFKSGEFHVFPDKMAKQIQAAYASFAQNVIEAKS